MAEYELPENFMDLGDDEPVAPGAYDLIIETVEEKKSKETKSPMILCMIEIDGYPDAGRIFHNFMIPTAESKKFTNQMSKRFLMMFNIDFSQGINPLSFVGARASSAALELDKNQNGDTINKIVLPKIPTD